MSRTFFCLIIGHLNLDEGTELESSQWLAAMPEK